MAARRTLKFDSLDEIVRDAEQLLAAGYNRVGKWDLAQACGHVSEWMRYGMDGFPRAPWFLRPMFWLLRNTVGGRIFRRSLATLKMPDGAPTAPESVPQPDGDAAAAVARLKEIVKRMKAFPGEPIRSPFLGRMTRDEWVKLHLMHAGHHLGFLIPKHG